MSSLLTPCECGHGMGSHSTLVGHCCATAGAGPRRVTGTCRCKRYAPMISNPDNNMSETRPQFNYLAIQPAPIAGKADEMPLEVGQYIADVRRNVTDAPHVRRGPAGNTIRWLADDRERLLAALDRAHRKIADWESTFRAAEAAAQQWDAEWERLAGILGLSKEDETEPPGLVTLVAEGLDRAQRERDEVAVAVSAHTYEACIAIAEKVASHTDDLMRGAVRTQSSGGAGHAIGYGSAAREVVEQIEELRRAWPVLPDTTANLASHTPPEGKND